MKHVCTTLLVCLFDFISAQIYTIDFGTDTGVITCNIPYTGATVYQGRDTIIPQTNLYDVRFITSNLRLSDYTPQPCKFVIANPGDTSIGSESELQFIHGHYPDLRFQVADFATNAFLQMSFTIKIHRQSMPQWSYPNLTFYFGDTRSLFFDKNKTPNFHNTPHPMDTMVFGAIHFRSDGLLPNYQNAVDLMYGPNIYSPSIYHTWTPRLIDQGIAHRIQVFANTAGESVQYQSPAGTQTLLGRHYDVYVDGVQVHTSMGSVHYQGSDVSAFSWFVNKPNHITPIIIDDIEWSVGPVLTVLPITLSRFDAAVCVDNDRSVCLSWRTESEINNDRFVVEKSLDAIQFVPVGVVSGFGTSSDFHEYAFVDDKTIPGTTYYRLRQIDFDGRSQYSSVLAVSISQNNTECLVQTMFDDPTQRYVIHNTMGEIVATSEKQNTLPHGLYIVSLFRENTLMCRQKVWLE